MNFNETEGSQVFPKEWTNKTFGSAYEETVKDNYKGNFMSLIARLGPEKDLTELIEKHWNYLHTEKFYTSVVNENPQKYHQ